MSSKNLDAEIAIVGAGTAGLALAKQLQEQGRSFVLLEASHRTGGRVYTEYLQPGMPFDLGAHWIHSDKLNPFVQIAKNLGVEVLDDKEDYTYSDHFVDGNWLPKSASREFSRYFEDQFDAIEELAKASDDHCVYDAIDNESRWAPYFYLYYGQDFTCDVDMNSVKDVAAYVTKGIDLAVTSGFGALLQKYAANVPVELNTAVSRIDSSGPGVRLTTNKGALRVAKVVVTVSTGVLATGQIEFLPGLPDSKREAIQQLPLGSCTRVGLTFAESFLDELPEDFTIRKADDEPLHFRNYPCGHKFVEVTTGGRLAEWMEKSGEQATTEFIIERLRQLLGNDAQMTLTRRIVSAWGNDAWTKGSYSYAIPNAQHQRARLAEPLDEKIYFAGEATSADYYSTVHGAYFSAVDVASAL